MEAGSCRRLYAVEPQIAEVERTDEGVDHANRVLIIDPVVEILRQKRRLCPIRSLDKSLHDHPRESSGHLRIGAGLFTQPGSEAEVVSTAFHFCCTL